MKPLKIVLTPTRNRRLNELIGLLVVVAAILLLLCLVSYRPTDPSLDTVGGFGSGYRAHNWTGRVGAVIADLLLQIEGAAALSLPLMLSPLDLPGCVRGLRARPGRSYLARHSACSFSRPSLDCCPAIRTGCMDCRSKVLTGRLVADLLVDYLNFPGACIVIVSMVAVALYLSTTFSFNTARDWIAIRLAFVMAWRDRLVRWKAMRAKSHAEKQAAEGRGATREGAGQGTEGSGQERQDARAQHRSGKKSHCRSPSAVHSRRCFRDPPPQQSVWETMPRARVPDPEPEPEPEPKPVALRVTEASPAPAFRSQKSIAVNERADADVKSVTVAPKSVSGFRLPPSTLLHRSEETQVVREDELRTEAQVLVEKCAEFDVTGQVVQINPGPVVTTFEFRPEAGVKYSRVTGLAEDLCLAMRAESILIERMAGKSTVGIQVPNHERETIWLRDVVESENFGSHKSKLTLAMGKDINGRIVTADLATMPHILIAGSTGSGKSVAINAMIMSVLFKATPEQVRMILVDPKRVELGMYEGVPHLFTPIITEPKLAANALRNAVREMERRLKLLASRSVRNIDQYNKLFENGTPSLFEDTDDQEPLPYIIIIIDELADLMMLDKANVEESITRLAQMARAVGIHLVLATQRPSVDVITGLIKANVPTRMSFRLATKVDSRTILDSNGAESLLGRGDMLFLPPGTSRLQRLHAPFVTEKEITAVVEFWKKQGEAEYVQGFLEGPKDDKGRDLEMAPEDGGEGNDELYEDGVRLVLEFGKASTSLLQRRLRIGYGRAAHLIDMMERDGIVGPADGSKPREILKPPDWLSEVESAIR